MSCEEVTESLTGKAKENLAILVTHYFYTSVFTVTGTFILRVMEKRPS